EYIVLPGRPQGVTRFGPLLHATFSQHLEGFAAFSFVVDSPDGLGVLHGSYAIFGLLHRWAHRFQTRPPIPVAGFVWSALTGLTCSSTIRSAPRPSLANYRA